LRRSGRTFRRPLRHELRRRRRTSHDRRHRGDEPGCVASRAGPTKKETQIVMHPQKITYVSALYDIGRKVNDEISRFDNYVGWARELLKLPIKIVFFTSEEIYERLAVTRLGLNYIVEPRFPWKHRIPEVMPTWEPGNTGDG